LLTWLHEVMSVKAPVSAASTGGLYFWKDGRDVPDVLNSVFEYQEGFVADMYVHLANSFPAPSHVIMGTKGSLVDAGNKLILYSEPTDHGVQAYGTLQWPKTARAAYFEAKGWTSDGRPRKPFKHTEPEEILIPRGPSHAEHFVNSIRTGKPSRENAEEGHLAAGAAHVANLAYRKGRKVSWDWRSNTVSEA
jgi:predicted dehydrogenase